MKRFLALIFIISLIYLANALAGTGTSGAQFLQLSAGGRPSSLGGAYTAFAQGVEAVYINPAGLAHLNGRQAVFTHYELYADMSYENIAIGIPVSNGAFTISAVGFLSGEIQRTTIEEPEGLAGDNFSANDFSFNLSYSRNLTDKFSAGATFKLLILRLAEVGATGVAFDVGAMYDIGVQNIRIGFTINNFGPDLRYQGEALAYETRISDNPDQASDVNANYLSEYFQLPLTFRVGLAYDPVRNENHRITLLADGLNPNDQKENLALGLEYAFKESYFIRAGHAGLLNNGYKDGGINQRTYTFGAGALLNISTTRLKFDYSFEGHQYLSNISSFSVGFIF
jgi:long-subunit fatty acid transport protein